MLYIVICNTRNAISQVVTVKQFHTEKCWAKNSGVEGLNEDFDHNYSNSLNLKIKIKVLICCPFSFPTEVVEGNW